MDKFESQMSQYRSQLLEVEQFFSSINRTPSPSGNFWCQLKITFFFVELRIFRRKVSYSLQTSRLS